MKSINALGSSDPDVAFDVLINLRDNIARKAIRIAEMFRSPIEHAIDALVDRSNPQGVAPVDQQRIGRHRSSVKSRHLVSSPGSIHKFLKSEIPPRTRDASPNGIVFRGHGSNSGQPFRLLEFFLQVGLRGIRRPPTYRLRTSNPQVALV